MDYSKKKKNNNYGVKYTNKKDKLKTKLNAVSKNIIYTLK